jgi:hypothetical protein
MLVDANSDSARADKSHGSKITKKKDEKKKDEKPADGAAASKESSSKDTKVTISPEAKKAATESSTEDKELKEAEGLMDHVNGGKLSDHDREMAMSRVGEILKKYGKA